MLACSHWLLYLPYRMICTGFILRTSNQNIYSKTRYYDTLQHQASSGKLSSTCSSTSTGSSHVLLQTLHLEARLPVTRPVVRELQDQDQRYSFHADIGFWLELHMDLFISLNNQMHSPKSHLLILEKKSDTVPNRRTKSHMLKFLRPLIYEPFDTTAPFVLLLMAVPLLCAFDRRCF